MSNRNTKIFTAALAALLAIATLGTGAVAAETTVVIEEEIEIDEDTEEIWAEVNASADLADTDEVETTFSVEGVEDGDTENATELDSEVINVAPDTTESYNYVLADSDAENYETVLLTVEVTDTEFSADDIQESEWGTIESLVGGGSSTGGITGIGTTGLVALVAVLGGGWYLTRDD